MENRKYASYTYNGMVFKVVDGDTIDVMLDLGFSTYRKVRCRLLEFYAPEVKTPQGSLVKEFLKEYLNDKPVIVFSKTIDRYGRSLARVQVQENSILIDVTKILKSQFPQINFEAP